MCIKKTLSGNLGKDIPPEVTTMIEANTIMPAMHQAIIEDLEALRETKCIMRKKMYNEKQKCIKSASSHPNTVLSRMA